MPLGNKLIPFHQTLETIIEPNSLWCLEQLVFRLNPNLLMNFTVFKIHFATNRPGRALILPATVRQQHLDTTPH